METTPAHDADRRSSTLAAFFLLCPFLLLPASVAAQDGPIVLRDPVFSVNPTTAKPKQVYFCRPGPWGELEYYYTFLEAPDSLVELASVPSQQTVWRFMGMSADGVKTLIRESGLPEPLQSELIERSLWYTMEGEIRVHPSAEIIATIPAGTRTKLYETLRGSEENPFHRAPIVIESGDVRQFFEGSRLSDRILAAIERTAYPLGGSLVFSDVPFVLGQVTSDEEERRLLKALTRTRSLILRLRILPESDTRELAEYWTAGFKHKEVLPILESILRAEGVERLDVVHLLPPTPRKHLYTFPPLSAGISGRFPDCFWTSLNFFEFSPKESFHDAGAAVAHVKTEYEPAHPPYRFGDVVFLSHPGSGRVIHSFVYIADDIVYTKNGEHVFRPWLLMKMDDLIARHQIDGELTVAGWRRKKATGVPEIPQSNRVD